MGHYEFTIHLDRQPTDDDLDTLYEAGFSDSSPIVGNGIGIIEVDRESESLCDALNSAISQANEAGFTVTGVEDEDLVGRSTIATRLGVSAEYVRLLTKGERGPGGFPVVQSGDGWALYSWTQVAAWAREHLGADIPPDDNARILTIANHLLRAKALAQESDRELFTALAS
ncbi:MAG: hypothetical protein LBB58_07065 [Cellulomonadaceae bacterium]|jgi:hypothetical protein|nr:hypothetical protein [Cellulomonadaceae bacterium]